MSSSFDPYYQWLGIPPKDQPPNHYRLLSIELFEDNPDVIERAADRHMAHLRTLQSGRHGAESQRLLNEIAAAKVCLLNPEKKAEYDRSLKSKLAPARAAAPAVPMARVIEPQMRATPAIVPSPYLIHAEAAPDTVDLTPSIAVDPGEASAIRRVRGSHVGSAKSSPKPLWQQPAAIILAIGGAGIALLTIAAIAFLLLSDGSSPDVVSGNSTPPRNAVAQTPADSKENNNEASSSLAQPQSSDPASRPAEVPEDAILWNGNWYWFSSTPENWDSAAAHASRLNARWVAISSPEENAFVAAQMKNSSYLGLHKVQQGKWVNSLGQQAMYLNWSSPPTADGDAVFIGKDGKWKVFRGNSGARLYVALEWGQEQPAGGNLLAAADQAADTRSVWVYQVNGGGSYRKSAGGWVEQSAQSGMFRFDERDRTAEYVELYDPRRSVQVRLYDERADITRSTNNFKTSYPGRWQQPVGVASQPPKPPVAGPGQTYTLEFRDKAFVELAGTKGLTSIAGNFTAEMWLRLQPTASAMQQQYLMGDGARGGVHADVPGADTAGWFLVGIERPQAPPSSQSSLVFRWGEANGQTLATTGMAPSLSGDWHHVALCNSASPGGNWTLTMYVDGKSAANHTRPYTQGLVSPGNLYVGSPEFTRPPDQFHGTVRAFRLSSSVRYSQAFNPPSNFTQDADTLVLLDFSQARADQITDISGNGHDGKIRGATWVVVDPMRDSSPADTPAAPPPALAQQKPKDAPPEAADQKQTLDQIREIFSAEYENAKTPVEKLTLAETFLKNAAEESDKTARYVLLEQARDLAAEAGNWYMAVRAVDELSSVYDVDDIAMKAAALKSFSTFAKLPLAKRTLAELAIDVTNEAVDRDQYDVATEVQATAVSAARSSGDRELLKAVLDRGSQISQNKQVWKSAQEANQVIAASPDDAAANLTLGRYLGFVKGDWAAALPHLAKGEDASLAELAKTDLTSPSDADGQKALADQWSAWGDKASGTDQNGAWVRAQHWYGEALPKLSGLSRAGISKKLEELAEKSVPIGSKLQARFAWLNAPVGELRRLTGHSQQVAALAVSRSGRLLASASYDGTVRIWELATGKELKQIGGAASGNVYSVVFTADEKFVIVGTSRPGLTVLNVETGAPTGQIKTQYAVNDLAISPDGRKLLWTARIPGAGNVGLLDIAGGRDLGRLSSPSYPNAVCFSADGRLALTGDQSNVALIWDLLTGMPVVRIDGHPSAVNDVAFSPDGRLVATCCSSDVYVWNARTGEQVHHFANVSSPRCVAFSPDNRRLMSGGYYTELIIWDAVSGKEVQRLRTDPPTTYLYVQSLAYLPDPRGAVTGSNDGTIRVWRLPD